MAGCAGLTAGLVYDRVSFTWVSPEEMACRVADREARIAQRKAGLCTPMVIGDSLPKTTSMVDGRDYDSKAALRAHYKRENVAEVYGSNMTIEPAPIPSNKPAVVKALQKAGVWDSLPA